MSTSKEEEPKGLTLDQKAIEILVANIIPTSKYFESRFDNLQYQVNEIKDDIKNLESRMDKRFQQVEDKLDKIIDRIDRRIDEGLRENRAQSMRMFTFAMTFSAISMLGLIGKMLKLF